MKLFSVKLKESELFLLCAVMLSLFFLFNFYWKNSSAVTLLSQTEAKNIAAKTQLSENQVLLDKLNKRGPSSDAIQNEYLDQYVLVNDRFSSIITKIVSSSNGHGFTLSKLSLDDQSTESGYKKMLYSLDAEASFIDIGRFLEQLEDAPLLTEVNSVEINRIDNEMKRCRARIKLYSYVRSE